MTNDTGVLDLSARRWAASPASNAHTPLAVLKEAIRQIEAGELQADHVIIAVGMVSDDTAQTEWLQGGKFDVFGQRGLIAGVQMSMFGVHTS